MKKMTWREAYDYMIRFNQKHGKTSKGDKKALCEMIVVITADTWNREYSEVSRSYLFTNDNKAFLPNMIGSSIFGYCLDGTDQGVRLDYYIGKEWTVDYCYLKED